MDFSHIVTYDGEKPYIFISYAHKDTDVVLPIVSELQQRGYRVWFDQGIEAGTEWSNNIAKHLRDCSAFLFFASHNSAASENCLDEISYAKSNQKSALMIFLEDDVVLPEGTEMQTARFQRMYKTRHKNLIGFMDKLCEAPLLHPCKKEEAEMAATSTPVATAEPTPPAKKRPVILAGAALAVVALVVCLLAFLPKGGENPAMPTETTAPQELSDDPMDFTFRLDGKVYKLPFQMSEVLNAGWILQDGAFEPDALLGGGQSHNVKAQKDDKILTLILFNGSGNAKKQSECFVCGIGYNESTAPQIEIAGGLSVNASAQDIINAYGTPSDQVESEFFTSITYNKDSILGQNNTYAKFWLDKEDPENDFEFEMCNFVLEETATNTERPAYLDDYKTATALADDLLDPTVQIEGELYTLPAPVSEFQDKGWTITSQSGSVVSGDTATIVLSKGGKRLPVVVKNFSLYQTLPELCAVTGFSLYEDCEAEILFGGGVSLTDTMEAFEQAAEDRWERSASGGNVSYTYMDDVFYVDASFVEATGELRWLYMNVEEWTHK